MINFLSFIFSSRYVFRISSILLDFWLQRAIISKRSQITNWISIRYEYLSQKSFCCSCYCIKLRYKILILLTLHLGFQNVIPKILPTLDATLMMATEICMTAQKIMDTINKPVMKLARNIPILLFKTMDGVYVELRMQQSHNMRKNLIENVEIRVLEVDGEIQFTIPVVMRVIFTLKTTLFL